MKASKGTAGHGSRTVTPMRSYAYRRRLPVRARAVYPPDSACIAVPAAQATALRAIETINRLVRVLPEPTKSPSDKLYLL